LQETRAVITFFWQIRLLADADIPSTLRGFRILHG
jgi:hypothetical protein